MQVVASAGASPDSPDWNLIQSLYLQGKTPKEIEAMTGVKAGAVSVRANRKGWTVALAKSKPMVQVTVGDIHPTNGEQPAESKLAKHSEAVRAGLADVLRRSVEKIQAISLKTPKAALKANQELESVVRNAKTVFGWSEGQSSPSVRIAIMGSTSVQIDQDPRPVIDIPQVENKVEPQV